MAQRMTAAHAQVVPASVTDEADIDDWATGEDATIRLVRAIAAACKAEPVAQCLVQCRARASGGSSSASTSASPSIPRAASSFRCCAMSQSATHRDLRAGLDRMRADAVARSIPPEELRGATITLSNFGMIGGRFANLVVVPPQVAIIGAGRIAQRVVAHRGPAGGAARAAVVAHLRPSRGDRRRSRSLPGSTQVGS